MTIRGRGGRRRRKADKFINGKKHVRCSQEGCKNYVLYKPNSGHRCKECKSAYHKQYNEDRKYIRMLKSMSREFTLIPEGRDLQAKHAYVIFEHLLRKHAPELKAILNKAYEDIIKTGAATITIDYDSIKKAASERISREMDRRNDLIRTQKGP